MTASTATEEGGICEEEVGGQRARVMSPSTTEEIQDAIRGGCFIHYQSEPACNACCMLVEVH